MHALIRYVPINMDKYTACAGGYKILQERLPQYVVPDLTGFKVNPLHRLSGLQHSDPAQFDPAQSNIDIRCAHSRTDPSTPAAQAIYSVRDQALSHNEDVWELLSLH